MFVVCQILTPLFEARRLVDRMDDQRTSYGAKDKRSSVQQISVLDVNRYSFMKKTGPICLALVGLRAGWLAGWLTGWQMKYG